MRDRYMEIIIRRREEAARRRALEEAKSTGPPAPKKRKKTSSSSTKTTSSSSTKTTSSSSTKTTSSSSSTDTIKPPTTKSIYDSKAWKDHTQSSQWSGVNVETETEIHTVKQTPDQVYTNQQRKIETQRTDLKNIEKEGHQIYTKNLIDTAKSRYDHAVAYNYYMGFPADTTFKTESGEKITRDQAISSLKDTFPDKGISSYSREYIDFKRDVKSSERDLHQYERDLDMWYKAQTRGTISIEEYEQTKSNIKKSGFVGLLATAFTPSDPLGLRSAYHVFKGDMDKAWDVKVSGVYDTQKPFHKFYWDSPMGTVGKMYMLKGATMGIKYGAVSLSKPIISKTPAIISKFEKVFPKAAWVTKPVHSLGHKEIGMNVFKWAKYNYVPFDKAVQTGTVLKTKGLFEVRKSGFKITSKRTFLPKTDVVIRRQHIMLSQKPAVEIGFPKISPSGTGGEVSMVSGGTWYKKPFMSALRSLKYKRTSIFRSANQETGLFKISKLADKPVVKTSSVGRVGDSNFIDTKSKLPWLKTVEKTYQKGYASETYITESGKKLLGKVVAGDPSYSSYKMIGSIPHKPTVLQRFKSGFRRFKASDIATVSRSRTVGGYMRPLRSFSSIGDKRSFLYIPAEQSLIKNIVPYSSLLVSPRYETSMKPVSFSAPALSSIQDRSVKSSKISMPVMGVASVSISDMDMGSRSISKSASVQIQKRASVQVPVSMKKSSVYTYKPVKTKPPVVPGIPFMPFIPIFPKFDEDHRKVKKYLYDKKVLLGDRYRFRKFDIPSLDKLFKEVRF